MKVPPKRKGNDEEADNHAKNDVPLNESPSEKEGKWPHRIRCAILARRPQ